MIIGLPKEIKNNEFRVGMTPDGAKAFCDAGHTVLVETNAGLGSGFTDKEYRDAGAQILGKAADVWEKADMIYKVKEPIQKEYPYFREGQTIYTYFHLAADRPLTEALLKSKVRAVAFETIFDANGGLPCLLPMSEIAGRLSVQQGAKYLEKTFGGRGTLLAGVPGVERGNIVILGGGGVGTNACKMAVGMGANVTVLDISAKRLAYLDDIFFGKITTLYSTRANVLSAISKADVVIGAVLLPGRATPKLVRRDDLKLMKPGAVLVDVAIDQGGCFETSHATTHDDPVFLVDQIVHYCVANMPGAVSRTSTLALANATLPYGLKIANKGLKAALKEDAGLMSGLNCYDGKCTFAGVSDALKLDYTNPSTLL
ncbi:alanine dehydrogenase [Caproiciproducens sp. NJN-50]|uniref:alanine dehydrogenase n=1 Tax=Acutalibacteraceae TaxID=3082771 RepID=UPI000FFE159D|nr:MULTISPECIES: alanine dehydrogenase [Acutalibacteraceae]QAT48682.1 alanine dehydrogenase [Caproiciproducens sp. NJN-50]